MSSDDEDRRARPQGTETSIARLEAEQGYDDDDEDAQDVNVGKSRDARREEEEDDEEDEEEDEDGTQSLDLVLPRADTSQMKETHAARRGDTRSREPTDIWMWKPK